MFFKKLRRRSHHRNHVDSNLEKDIVDRFHELYYNSHTFGKTWANTYWLGVPTLKCPLDLWIYQEIIFELRPDLIIESGTAHGGSALFLACMCDLINSGHVISIDIEEKEGRPAHNRIEYLHGSSISDEIVRMVKKRVNNADVVIVILDSDHHSAHVLKELNVYGEFVSKGSYMIVEDTNINGHPVAPNAGPGPMEAVEDFLKGNEVYVIDTNKEKFLMTFNPKGYLLKTK